MSAQPVDFDHLRQYTEGDPELGRALAEAFDESCRQFLPLLEAAADHAAWASAAHGLKGAARGIGAFPLGHLAERAEALTDPEARKQLLDVMRAAVADVRRVLVAMQ
jgi:HPt (histidine-containing phosphotransfer) domain-containing protein